MIRAFPVKPLLDRKFSRNGPLLKKSRFPLIEPAKSRPAFRKAVNAAVVPLVFVITPPDPGNVPRLRRSAI
jgi:hypothetical protein